MTGAVGGHARVHERNTAGLDVDAQLLAAHRHGRRRRHRERPRGVGIDLQTRVSEQQQRHLGPAVLAVVAGLRQERQLLLALRLADRRDAVLEQEPEELLLVGPAGGGKVEARRADVGHRAPVGVEQERVADGVGPANHLVPLVVVTEDHQPVAERLLGRRDAVDELVLGREGEVIRERSLETQHVGPPPFRGYSSSAGGWQPGRQHRGVVGLGALMETPDTGPACSHHNTHVEWKARPRFVSSACGQRRRGAGAAPGRRRGARS